MQTQLITVNGTQYRATSRAWWLDTAAATTDGRVEVARIEAESLTLRHPSKADMTADDRLSPYATGAAYTGRPVAYMLQLTDADIADNNIVPGKLDWPQVVDGRRPRTNITAQPVSARQVQQAQDWLQNDCIGSPAKY